MINKLYNFNWLFIFLVIILANIGFIALYSAAGSSLDPWAKKQIIRFVFGLILVFIISFINIRYWKKYAYHIFILSFLLIIGVEFFGDQRYGAQRWINIFGINIQPSELIKVTLILALSKFYSEIRYDHIGYIRNLFIPFLLIIIPFIFIILQPDLGTALMFFILGIFIMFIAGVRIWKFILSFFLTLITLPLAWNYLLKGYQKKRILSFLNPESDPLGSGYHLIQSKIALGSGGAYGKGFLKGSQSYLDFLPEKQTDFIFTMIGEEFGFIGSLFIISLYFLLILLCFYIAFQSFSIFGRIVAIGVGINLFLYVFLNTSMVIGMIPIVGVPLPLLSYGGTVMLSCMISFGFLQNVSVHRQLKIG